MANSEQYPKYRDWQGGYEDSFTSSQTLCSNWQYSRTQLHRVNDALASVVDDNGPISCVGVAGSYGRMEAAPHSDFDVLMIVKDDADAGSDSVRRAVEAIWGALESLNLQLPKDWGIFVTAASAAQLTQPQSLGDLGESRDLFGKRIQLLLDSQPAYGDTQFVQLQTRILDWYATAFVDAESDSQWTYLMNDLIRYYRSYAAWHQFKLSVEHDDSWFIRNAKLRTSRLVMFAAMLLSLGEHSRETVADPDTLLSQLRFTPLERVTRLFAAYSDTSGGDVIQCYDACFELLGDDVVRERLVNEAPQTLEDLCDKSIRNNPCYEPIAQHSGEIMRLLTAFTLARHDDWHPKYWQYLLF